MDKDRGKNKYHNKKVEKTSRIAKREENEFYFEERGRKKDKYPQEYNKNRKRERTESPEPKKYRNNSGINKGKAPYCSFCRPQICNRIYKAYEIKKEMRNLKKEILDLNKINFYISA